MATILIATPATDIADLLDFSLARVGYWVLRSQDWHHTLQTLREDVVDLALIDETLVTAHRSNLLNTLTILAPRLRVIVLASQYSDEDVCSYLAAGADDYALTSTSMRVLCQRVQAVLRRPVKSAGAHLGPVYYHLGSLIFDPLTHTVHAHGEQITLTHVQNEILGLLCRYRGRPIPLAIMTTHLQSHGEKPSIASLKVQVHLLRDKIAQLPGHPHPITTVQRQGYALLCAPDLARRGESTGPPP